MLTLSTFSVVQRKQVINKYIKLKVIMKFEVNKSCVYTMKKEEKF